MFNHRIGQVLATAAAAALTLAGLAALAPAAQAATGQLGDITSLTRDGDTFTVRSGTAALRVVVEDDSLLRVQVAPDGTFTDPANDDPTDPDAPDADIVVKTDYPGAGATLSQSATAYVIKTPKARLTLTKSPLTLHLAKADGTPLWDETAPLSWTDDGTTQTLAQGSSEQFFGGGMQNGRFSHRDSQITISRDYNWNDGGNPNAVPFYVSSNGYGVLRNTAQPGTKDNVASGGETISLSGKGNALAVLGTGTSGSASGTATVHYADGSVTTGTLGMPNWCCLATDSYGAKIAVVTKGKNTPTGPAYPTTEYRLYTKTVRVDPAKDVVAVTLPANAAVHVFGLTVGTEEVVAPPIADGQYSFSTGGKALQATDQELGQLIVAAPGSDADQKWVVSRNADELTYQLKNTGTGLCADVPYSSTTSGQGVGQYTCSGTPNQQWVISNAAGVLTLKAKHSGLSLTAGADGKVVQATDTGAPGQRWTATAS